MNLEKTVSILSHGNFSHANNLQVIEIARENGVITVSIPPHSSHNSKSNVKLTSPSETYTQ